MSDTELASEATETAVPEVRVGLTDRVIYRNRDGREMAAIVAATPDTTVASAPGTVTLWVLSPRSGAYLKNDVAEGEGPGTYTVL